MANDAIATALNIAPVPVEAEPQLPAVSANVSPVTDTSDIELAQQNLKTLAEKGENALNEIMEVAQLSQHPRAYEVVATTLATLAEINAKLIASTKVKRDLGETKSGGDASGPKTINNQNLFVGSTAELAKFLELQRNGRLS